MPVSTIEEFDALAPTRQDEEYSRVAALEAALRSRLLARRVGQPAADRAIRIEEAVDMLGCTKDHAYRHWAKLGGYKDEDGHLKISLATVQAHIRQGGQA